MLETRQKLKDGQAIIYRLILFSKMLIHTTLSSPTAVIICYRSQELQSTYSTPKSAIQVLLSVTVPGMNNGFPPRFKKR